MYCKNCGKELKENTKFCPKCGTIQQMQSLLEENTVGTPAKSKGITIILICLILLAAVGSILFFFKRGNDDSAKPETEHVVDAETEEETEVFTDSTEITEIPDSIETVMETETVWQVSETEETAEEYTGSAYIPSKTPHSVRDTNTDYIFLDSAERYLTDDDIKGLSSHELMLARNEIYARHGRKFKDEELQTYFNSKTWYSGYIDADDFSTDVFNTYEKKNIELIQSYE